MPRFHLGVPDLELLNHLLLVSHYFLVLHDYAAKYLHTVMRLLKASRNFTVALGTSDGHVRTTLFQMGAKLSSTAEELRLRQNTVAWFI